MIFFVSIALICAISYGQPVTWMKSYGWPGTDVANAIIQTPDNGYLVTGRSVLGLRTLRLNEFGDTIWNKIFPGTEGRQIISTNDGNYVILGQYARITKIDLGGNIIWTSVDLDVESATEDIVQLPDNGFMICGTKDTLGVFGIPILIRTNSNGSLLWKRTYTEGIIDGLIRSLILTMDNSLVCTGRYSDTVPIIDALFIMKTDLSGEVLFFYGYDTLEYYYDVDIVNETPEGSFVVGGGRPFIAKISPTGIFESYHNYYTNGSLMAFEGLSTTNEGGYVATGHWDTAGNSQEFPILLLKVDSNLNEIFRRVYLYERFDDNDGKCIVQTSDSGYVIAGMRANQNLVDYAILKTDKYGNINTVGVTPISHSIPANYELRQNYPNPFNPETKIRFDIPSSGEINMTVYDILGRIVYSIAEYKTAGSYEVRFDGTNLASGMYFYELVVGDPKGTNNTNNGGFRDVKKMVLIK